LDANGLFLVKSGDFGIKESVRCFEERWSVFGIFLRYFDVIHVENSETGCCHVDTDSYR
jgi:hypothetical protein